MKQQSFGRSKSSNKGSSTQHLQRNQDFGRNANLNNEWIPTEAVRAIQKIKEVFEGQMTETCVSQILYELNSIWRSIMRKENDSIKKKLTI